MAAHHCARPLRQLPAVCWYVESQRHNCWMYPPPRANTLCRPLWAYQHKKCPETVIRPAWSSLRAFRGSRDCFSRSALLVQVSVGWPFLKLVLPASIAAHTYCPYYSWSEYSEWWGNWHWCLPASACCSIWHSPSPHVPGSIPEFVWQFLAAWSWDDTCELGAGLSALPGHGSESGVCTRRIAFDWLRVACKPG